MTPLDADVLSEPMRPVPDRPVIAWLDGLDPAALQTTESSLAELRHGALRRRLPLATRNTRDFALLGIDLVDPFG